MTWKSCVVVVFAQAKLVGNNTKKVSNSDISNFTLLKSFGINLIPRKALKTMEVLWPPPLTGWIKCNIDRVAVGIPSSAACGGIYRDHNADHVLSFCDFIGLDTSENVELVAALMAIEIAKQKNFSKLWMKTDCTFVVYGFKNHGLMPWNYTLKIDFMITHQLGEPNFCADSLATVDLKAINLVCLIIFMKISREITC